MNIDKSLSYKKQGLSHPRYRLQKVMADETATITNTSSGGQYLNFSLPPIVFNLSKSVLAAKITPKATTAVYNFLWADVLTLFDNVVLADSQGFEIAKVNTLNFYLKTVNRCETSYKRFLTMPQADDCQITPNTSTTPLGVWSGIQRVKCQYDALTVSTNTSIVSPVAALNYLLVPNTVFRRDYSKIESLDDVQELFYYRTTNKDQPVISLRFQLSDIHNTLFSVDKCVFFDQNVSLRFLIAPTTQMGYQSDSITAAGTIQAYAANIEISSPALYLSVQIDEEVNQEIRAQVRGSGLEILHPAVEANSKTISAAGSQTVSWNYSNMNGNKSLIKVYHTLFPSSVSTTSAHNVYNNSNTSSADAKDLKVSVYHTELNLVNEQGREVDTSENEDWVLLQENFEGSLIRNQGQYEKNWVHISNYGTMPVCEQDLSNTVQGLSLSQQPLRFDFVGTCSADMIHRTYAIVQRVLKISSQGNMFV